MVKVKNIENSKTEFFFKRSPKKSRPKNIRKENGKSPEEETNLTFDEIVKGDTEVLLDERVTRSLNICEVPMEEPVLKKISSRKCKTTKKLAEDQVTLDSGDSFSLETFSVKNMKEPISENNYLYKKKSNTDKKLFNFASPKKRYKKVKSDKKSEILTHQNIINSQCDAPSKVIELENATKCKNDGIENVTKKGTDISDQSALIAEVEIINTDAWENININGKCTNTPTEQVNSSTKKQEKIKKGIKENLNLRTDQNDSYLQNETLTELVATETTSKTTIEESSVQTLLEDLVTKPLDKLSFKKTRSSKLKNTCKEDLDSTENPIPKPVVFADKDIILSTLEQIKNKTELTTAKELRSVKPKNIENMSEWTERSARKPALFSEDYLGESLETFETPIKKSSFKKKGNKKSKNVKQLSDCKTDLSVPKSVLNTQDETFFDKLKLGNDNNGTSEKSNLNDSSDIFKTPAEETTFERRSRRSKNSEKGFPFPQNNTSSEMLKVANNNTSELKLLNDDEYVLEETSNRMDGPPRCKNKEESYTTSIELNYKFSSDIIKASQEHIGAANNSETQLAFDNIEDSGFLERSLEEESPKVTKVTLRPKQCFEQPKTLLDENKKSFDMYFQNILNTNEHSISGNLKKISAKHSRGQRKVKEAISAKSNVSEENISAYNTLEEVEPNTELLEKQPLVTAKNTVETDTLGATANHLENKKSIKNSPTKKKKRGFKGSKKRPKEIYHNVKVHENSAFVENQTSEHTGLNKFLKENKNDTEILNKSSLLTAESLDEIDNFPVTATPRQLQCKQSFKNYPMKKLKIGFKKSRQQAKNLNQSKLTTAAKNTMRQCLTIVKKGPKLKKHFSGNRVDCTSLTVYAPNKKSSLKCSQTGEKEYLTKIAVEETTKCLNQSPDLTNNVDEKNLKAFDDSDLLGLRRSGRNKSTVTPVDQGTPEDFGLNEIISGEPQKCLVESESTEKKTAVASKLSTEMYCLNAVLTKETLDMKNKIQHNEIVKSSSQSDLCESRVSDDTKDYCLLNNQDVGKSRRLRKIIDYNEDNLEKRAIRVANSLEVKEMHPLNQSLTNNKKMSPIKKNRSQKSSLINNKSLFDGISKEEPLLSKHIHTIQSNDINFKESNLNVIGNLENGKESDVPKLVANKDLSDIEVRGPSKITTDLKNPVKKNKNVKKSVDCVIEKSINYVKKTLENFTDNTNLDKLPIPTLKIYDFEKDDITSLVHKQERKLLDENKDSSKDKNYEEMEYHISNVADFTEIPKLIVDLELLDRKYGELSSSQECAKKYINELDIDNLDAGQLDVLEPNGTKYTNSSNFSKDLLQEVIKEVENKADDQKLIVDSSNKWENIGKNRSCAKIDSKGSQLDENVLNKYDNVHGESASTIKNMNNIERSEKITKKIEPIVLEKKEDSTFVTTFKRDRRAKKNINYNEDKNENRKTDTKSLESIIDLNLLSNEINLHSADNATYKNIKSQLYLSDFSLQKTKIIKEISRGKKSKKNIMDIDVANILETGNSSENRRSPRKKKISNDSKSVECLEIAQDVEKPNTEFLQNQFMAENQISFSDTEAKTNIHLSEQNKVKYLQNHSNKQEETKSSTTEIDPDTSESNESLPLLNRINNIDQNVKNKNNIFNNTNTEFLNQSLKPATEFVTEYKSSFKDSLANSSVSFTDELFKATNHLNQSAKDKLVNNTLETLLPLPPNISDSMENLVLENKPVSSIPPCKSKIKRRKKKKKKDTNQREGKPLQSELIEESPTVTHLNDITKPKEPLLKTADQNYQLAKLNIKSLLLSSIAPPKSDDLNWENVLLQNKSSTSSNLKDIDNAQEQGEIFPNPENISTTVESKLKSTKRKGKMNTSTVSPQNDFEIFDKSLQTNSSLVRKPKKESKHLLGKNFTFTALKNVLGKITKPVKMNKHENKEVMLSGMEPLTDIITSSEMDIAPVLDEIDKSLESEDVFDFNYEEVSEKSASCSKNKGSKKKPIKVKLRPKSDNSNYDQGVNKEIFNNLQKVGLLLNEPTEKDIGHGNVDKQINDLTPKEVFSTQSSKLRRRSKSLDMPIVNSKDIECKKSNKKSHYTTTEFSDNSSGCETNKSKLLEETKIQDNTSCVKVHKNTCGKDNVSEYSTGEENNFKDQCAEANAPKKNNIEYQNLTDIDFEKEIENFSDGQELRRSRRGSRKVASYNENDLIDPLIDALENQRNRPLKKDRSMEKQSVKKDLSKDLPPEKPKLNSEELFDLLKNSSYENESLNILKPRNSFLENLNQPSSNTDFHDISDDDFKNILEKPSLILTETEEARNIDKIYEFTEDSPEDPKKIKEFGKSKRKYPANQQNISSESRINSVCIVENNTSVSSNALREKDVEQEKNNYCEICKKTFIRMENLIKHKTTLTHISKLSEIEAKEAEEKIRVECERKKLEKQSDSMVSTSDSLKDQINITDILQQSETTRGSSEKHSSSLSSNHPLNLVDIISDVLNKPVLENYNSEKHGYSELTLQNSDKHDIKRYKSLGERKSFESENQLSQISTSLSESYLPSPMSKTTILENQINLLENIIGNKLETLSTTKPNTNNDIIDEVSSYSNDSNISTVGNNSCISNRSTFKLNSKILQNNSGFIKPTHYEEISEDSANARLYDDPKLRKTLNRDEELFLECCSLLKSGSEVSNSNYSKNMKKPLGHIKESSKLKSLNNKKLIQTVEEAHEYSDNSRTPTPLGDTYDDEASNSNTISSNWNLKSEKPLDENRSFSFEEVVNKEEAGISFGEILTKGLRNQFEYVPKPDERNKEEIISKKKSIKGDKKDDSDCSTTSKKISTKGARKVFEGLKVSIPTEDLNLEVLNNSLINKKSEFIETLSSNENPIISHIKPRSTRKSKPVKKSQVGSNLLFKVTKKKTPRQTTSPILNENQDVYNFEETQDTTNVFTEDVQIETTDIKNKVLATDSDNESLGYADSIGADAKSVSSVSSISAISAKKPETTPENITKKKYKIMGKIFRNAAKSKIDEIDDELRHIPEIPEIDNIELVENYVRSCQRIKSPFLPPPPPPPLDEGPKKPKMTEEEMNLLFDQLLGKEVNEFKLEKSASKLSLPKIKADSKNSDAKKRVNKIKNRKRARVNSESSGDEFNINKTAKKRTSKKNTQEDSGINLEQELKECIGVASRKSQRKCTSGKQNVLVEYWSSDEEAFEAMLDSQKLQAKNDEQIKKIEQEECDTNDLPKDEANSEVSAKPIEKFVKPKQHKRKSQPTKKQKTTSNKKVESGDMSSTASNRRKRAAANPLYHWSSSSEDESQSLIEVKPIREEDDEEDRPVQHGWIVGDSPKKLVTMLALTKGKKTDIDSVKEQGKRRTSNTVS